MLNFLKLIFNTLRYLKLNQIFYRIFYFIRNKFSYKRYRSKLERKVLPLIWNNIHDNNKSYSKTSKFNFLNLETSFSDVIDWNYNKFGKLWTYNLNYFDFLNQKILSKNEGFSLIKNYVKNNKNLLDGKEPYPTSLRGINWVKFLSTHKIINEEVNTYLYNDFLRLIDNREYHLLGNHLLENGFSLLFGAYYFKDDNIYKYAIKVLNSELEEQILNDGAHFELSPMYHQIMLFRVLDSIQLIRLNNWKDDDLLLFLENIASKMLSWLKEVTFNNGDIPMVNDSAFGISPTTEQLLNYGNQLGLKINKIKLSDSGYRIVRNKKYELFMDVGGVGAPYQPGHVHSDTFNFVLYIKNQPFIVDTGTSTYEKNKVRQLERGTSSHNTVIINNQEQTQVWGGFRVAKRAKIISLIETNNTLKSTHDGYRSMGVSHTRSFLTEKDSIIIKDDITKQATYKQIANFHFHPSITELSIDNSKVFIQNKEIEIFFKGINISIQKEYYNFAVGFNKTEKAIKLKVLFESNLETIINI